MSSGPWKNSKHRGTYESYGPSLMSRQIQEAVGSSIRMKISVRSLLHEGVRCFLKYHVSGTEKYSGISEVVAMTEFFVVFRDIKTGIRHAFDYMDVYRGFTARGGGVEGTYLNSPLVVRRENNTSYAEV